ncbi:MAG: IPTL-CTERM sorting domain-containing protein [Candidatus Zixiibacteriota bacterium]|nr:MAG: IPTL-CTERM sorting domain-containing protein [candidate division Zixibacteria bacterium]
MKELVRGLFILFLLYGLASADWVPDDGHKMHYPQMPDTVGWDINATAPIILADDFMCTETGMVRDIHFWGAWLHDTVGVINSFILSFHSDIPADSPFVPYSRPGPVLWEHEISDFIIQQVDTFVFCGWYDPVTEEILARNHTAFFQYNVFLPESLWFPQDSGTIYWLNISANIQGPERRWGWRSSLFSQWNDDAVYTTPSDTTWFELYEPGFPYIPGDIEHDDDVDMDDAIRLYNYIRGMAPAPPYSIPGSNPPFYAAADVNGDCNDALGSDFEYLFAYLDSGGPPPSYCYLYPPATGNSLDLAFVITDNQAQENIPTLNEWGMLILALLLLAAGTVAVIRGRKVALRDTSQ